MMVTMHVDPSVLHYRIEIRPEVAADGSIVYMAEIPDLPGCMSHGSTIEEARQSLEDAKREYLGALEERHLSIPVPAPGQVVGSVTWTVMGLGPSGVEGVAAEAGFGSLRFRSRTEAPDPA